MGDRNEYMREYMREYRAAKKAAAAGQGQVITEGSGPAAAALTTEGAGKYKWVWWLIAGLVVGAAIYGCVYMVKHSTPGEREAFLDTLATESRQGDTTEPAPITTDSTEQEGQESTEPGQE